ncbi:MAG: metallophosphoesterase family protein [Desulfobacteraceae bacterium]|nr:metallophosphoesterase family protein [Desulfobacteraceae bacterium]
MIVIGISDAHDEIGGIDRMGDVLRRADLVLLTGDLTHFGHSSQAARVVEAVRRYAGCVLAVPGNCDHLDVNTWLKQEDINLHTGARIIGDFWFAGLGGSITTPFQTPFEYSEDRARQFISEAAAGLPEDTPFVLVSHQPPADTSCDRLSNGKSAGSTAVREFIETRQPLVCFTGHIHESVGTDQIGRTKIINPGQSRHGRYAYAEITDQEALVELRSV